MLSRAAIDERKKNAGRGARSRQKPSGEQKPGWIGRNRKKKKTKCRKFFSLGAKGQRTKRAKEVKREKKQTWERWESRLEACLHVCGGRWSWESVEAWCESLKLGSVSQESTGTRRKAEETTRNRAAGGAVNTAELTLLRPAGPG